MTVIAPYAESMPQLATYWPIAANDGYGGVTWGSPVTLMCRYQMKQTLVRAANGQEITSDTTVYVDNQFCEPKGYIALDDQRATPDPRNTNNARQIIAINSSPSLHGDEQLNWVLL